MFLVCCMISMRSHARSGRLLALAMPHDQPAIVVTLPWPWPFSVGTGATPTSLEAVGHGSANLNTHWPGYQFDPSTIASLCLRIRSGGWIAAVGPNRSPDGGPRPSPYTVL